MQNKTCDTAECNDEIRLGVDIGGTNVKFAVVKDSEIVYRTKIKTNALSEQVLLDDIAEMCLDIRTKYKFEKVGVGVTGSVENGIVYASNIPFDGTPLKDILSKRLEVCVEVDNDASCAGLGEMKYGVGKHYDNIIMITIGTGVGGCIITDRKLYRGKGAAGEIGHIIVQAKGGIKCSCGQSGCLEQYASATALLNSALSSANKNRESTLYRLYSEKGKMDGETLFDALNQGCPTAKKIIDEYTDMLAVGVDSIINIFDPDIIVLSGGITARGDAFIDKLKDKLHFKTPVVISNLQNDAGALGAASL